MIGFIFIAIITLYASHVIYKRMNNMKKGKFCNCGCSECQLKCRSKE
ncbi:FeoB-associated Cys-rich membrane protein [Clostridium botulinum]|uniref:FeoB-associated Cys-rich membrane protein n=1 Tax=Clostridium botulinum TaxID=1491 RepID=A0A6B4GSG0_CLOBO|nr:FeoB-associated Cys-rich membrane protein [Clostridium botulinum]NFD85786.1 FeoB-associated Cys-rich membrane protein [Clostridium botulinum]NFE07263.1 FeoB-associated Cys-rich membrane protein [Clostridium botulinum]NFE35444.1 FeoB-associated Cys-rich membrane protein [Clostridium botulinum]NFE49711.1 FeoB-associated Cys-rich membrane protein [Clostridium botulinum]